MICSCAYWNLLFSVSNINYPIGEAKLVKIQWINYYNLKKIYLGSHRFLFSLIYGYAIQWVIAECNGQWLADLVFLILRYHCLRFLQKPEKNRKWEESKGAFGLAEQKFEMLHLFSSHYTLLYTFKLLHVCPVFTC